VPPRATASRNPPRPVAWVAWLARPSVAATMAAILVGSMSGMSCVTSSPSLVATRLPWMPTTLSRSDRSSARTSSSTVISLANGWSTASPP
jgi:hypothetical protein